MNKPAAPLLFVFASSSAYAEVMDKLPSTGTILLYGTLASLFIFFLSYCFNKFWRLLLLIPLILIFIFISDFIADGQTRNLIFNEQGPIYYIATLFVLLLMAFSAYIGARVKQKSKWGNKI